MAMIVKMDLPADHWVYEPAGWQPPAPWLTGTADPLRTQMERQIRAAAQWAIRGATMAGTDKDFDPDAMVQNFVIGMLGFFTPDGRGNP